MAAVSHGWCQIHLLIVRNTLSVCCDVKKVSQSRLFWTPITPKSKHGDNSNLFVSEKNFLFAADRRCDFKSIRRLWTMLFHRVELLHDLFSAAVAIGSDTGWTWQRMCYRNGYQRLSHSVSSPSAEVAA